jgi:NADH:ubiquinone oxidoreductase subunit 3 (subunit A)
MTLFILVLFIPVLTCILLILNRLLAPVNVYAEKYSTYECGYDTVRGQTRAPFTISYYLVSVLFLAFDLEIISLYPLTVSLQYVGLYGFWVAVIFFLVLTLGFVVEIASGVLTFTDQRSAINKVTLSSQ